MGPYIEFSLGVLIAAVTLWDAFETVVLPRTVRRRYRLTRMIFRGLWLLLGAASRLPVVSARRESALSLFGPLLLIFLLIFWAVALIAGFGLMFSALGAGASESTISLSRSIYLSGSTFFTLGLGDVVPSTSAMQALAIVEAGTGFGFLAMVIGYLPIFYQAFSRREMAISLLDARAGSPPTAIELIRRNGDRAVEGLLADWESWAAELLESHLSYPVLALFRSQHERQSWLAALTAILDTCALAMTGIDGIADRQAGFTFGIARHALIDLAQVFFAEPTRPEPERLSHAAFLELAGRLDSYGLPFLKPATAEERLAAVRLAYEPLALAIGLTLSMELPPWLPEEERLDNWQTSPWDTFPAS